MQSDKGSNNAATIIATDNIIISETSYDRLSISSIRTIRFNDSFKCKEV